jgi:hypothetical protein
MTVYTKRSVLKMGIQQCKTKWNMTSSKGAMVNRIRKFKYKIRFFFKFSSFFSNTERVTGQLLYIKRGVLKRGIQQQKKSL